MDTFLGLRVPNISDQVPNGPIRETFREIQRFLDEVLLKSKQFAGSTISVTLVTQTRTNGGQLQEKTRTFTFRDGLLEDICNETDWTSKGAV